LAFAIVVFQPFKTAPLFSSPDPQLIHAAMVFCSNKAIARILFAVPQRGVVPIADNPEKWADFSVRKRRKHTILK
jgi:hypothetical protein